MTHDKHCDLCDIVAWFIFRKGITALIIEHEQDFFLGSDARLWFDVRY